VFSFLLILLKGQKKTQIFFYFINQPNRAEQKQMNASNKIAFRVAYFLFFLQAFFLPPVARLLCKESREIPNPYKVSGAMDLDNGLPDFKYNRQRM
jgi:hypothetical protein